MASSSSAIPGISQDSLASFHAHLARSKRVLALLGAGLSASSGLPTFRGAGGLWRTHDATSLATPSAFAADPGLVWQFYNYRRHMSLQAQPNPAHHALAELARRLPGFMALSQNVDGLSQRAHHPSASLQLLHGTLFELRCTSVRCGHRELNFTDPVAPALAIPTGASDPTTDVARLAAPADLDISDVRVDIPRLAPDDLPQCPRCQQHLLRPGVVWFGEALPVDVLDNVDAYLSAAGPYAADDASVDLIMVIGTSARVFPAAGYIDEARALGARVCVVNMDANDAPRSGWNDGDWIFKGDAAVIVPELLRPLIGDVGEVMAREAKI